MRWNYTFKEQVINCRTGFYLAGGIALLMAVFMGPTFSVLGEAALWILSVGCLATAIYGSAHS